MARLFLERLEPETRLEVVSVPAENAPASPLEWIDQRAAEGRPLHVLHPVLGWIPYEARTFQREVLDAWRERFRIIVKSRQIGFSQTFGIEMAYKALFHGPRRILCVSRNEDQAKDLLRYVREALDGETLDTDNTTEIGLTNGSRIKVQPAGRDAGRGYAASDVYGDEFAFAQWAQHIYRSILPSVSNGGSLTVFSSPNGRANLFYLLWSGQLGKEQWWRRSYDFRVMRPYGWDEDWEATQRAMMTTRDFAQEYMAAEGFVDSGDSRFREEDLQYCFGPVGDTAPNVTRRYIGAADVAGVGQDWNWVQIWDVTVKPYRLVRSVRWRQRPAEHLYQTCVDLCREYHCDEFHMDATSLARFGYEELEARLRPLEVMTYPFTFTSKSKYEALTKLQFLVEKHELRFDDAELLSELQIYQDDDKDLIQDGVMTAAILANAVQTVSRTLRQVRVSHGRQ